ncbi:MAG: hypothetical protein PHV18_15410 [Lachnospiraceae bacterium]|nr:hypothetical protein [Lachnospiraceae bacterium]
MKTALKNYCGIIPRIFVVVARGGNWRDRVYGEVIGNYDGTVGVLTAAGEYIDVPEAWVHVRRIKEDKDGR